VIQLDGRDAAGGGLARRPAVPRVYLLTDVRLYAEGLVHILEREPSIAMIGTSPSAKQALDAIAEASVEVILLDLKPPEGPAVARLIREAAPDVWLVALAVPEADDDVVAWAEAGIAGVLPRDGSFQDLVRMIHSVVHGETVCSPRVAAALLRRVAVLARSAGRPAPISTGSQLTYRETEVVRLMGRGLSNKEIAQSLGIALPTVKNHIHHVLEKLQVRTRSEAAAIVLRRPRGGQSMDLGY
jgi:two-component system nitrate/nitrite response regulator NarL